ncbi:hypothetical protein J2W88_002974 [Acidovorax delafieldii]|uniref:Uncharacterized protein n=1 Tax=Acidovorax delafieldii TaxID=47920 RepID=A0AAJ2BUK2_ACIDE|nr:hypothetical protein [Acidovorax delafieldii]MDR6767693.1 hypothetical protein [Acidovorax delafieldii]MDR6839675.1 hypothetical protein [Acidovorax delafieldii]MDR7368424.1 hypothetical protein [Acidovorax delafieldii]
MKRAATGPLQLTKDDTVALWYAVQAQGDMYRATRDLHRDEGKFTSEQIEADRQRLAQSKRALRKVNAIRKLQVEREPAGGAGP